MATVGAREARESNLQLVSLLHFVAFLAASTMLLLKRKKDYILIIDGVNYEWIIVYNYFIFLVNG